jgi:hypothetical protein
VNRTECTNTNFGFCEGILGEGSWADPPTKIGVSNPRERARHALELIDHSVISRSSTPSLKEQLVQPGIRIMLALLEIIVASRHELEYTLGRSKQEPFTAQHSPLLSRQPRCSRCTLRSTQRSNLLRRLSSV